MTSSDSTTRSSKEHAASWRGTPPLPLPEGVKKPEKKLETPVLVAMISAVVTLTAAVLGSPLLVSLVNKTGVQAPTPAPVIGIMAYTATPQGGTPTSTPPLLDSIITSTSLPTQKPEPTTPTADPSFQCIAADLWIPYPTTLNPDNSNGCWNLADWGFSTKDGQLLLVHNPGQDQQRGIYTPISPNVDIHFSVQLNEFRTRSTKVGFLNFGVVQNDPFSIYTGGYLSYEQTAPGSGSPVRVLISGTNQATQKISDLDVGFQHEVLLSIRDDQMTVYLNGEQTGDPVKLPPTDRAFWIGYVLPSKGELDVMITNFSIESR